MKGDLADLVNVIDYWLPEIEEAARDVGEAVARANSALVELRVVYEHLYA